MPRQSRERPWVMVFILLSLLAHLIFVLVIVLIGHYFPGPKLKDDPQPTSVSLTMEDPPPAPPPPLAPPPQQRPFVPTTADPNAPHKNTEIESDHYALLKTRSQVARDPESVMPDIVSKHAHPTDLNAAPNAPNNTPPHPAEVSATGSQNAQKQAATLPPQPTPQPQTQPSKAKEPSKTISTQPSNPTPKTKLLAKIAPQLDANGLPVLPALPDPTMAPASQRQEATPASSIPEIEQDVHGGIGSHGDNSPEAMATAFGKYKAYVRAVVGSYWYPRVDKQFQVMPVGLVHIQFTIHSDGSVETKVLEGSQGTMQLLLSISQNAIITAAPYKPFPPEMVQEVGDSYTDDFTFSIYGGGD